MNGAHAAVNELLFDLSFVLLKGNVRQLDGLEAVVHLVELVIDEGLRVLALALDLTDDLSESFLCGLSFAHAAV